MEEWVRPFDRFAMTRPSVMAATTDSVVRLSAKSRCMRAQRLSGTVHHFRQPSESLGRPVSVRLTLCRVAVSVDFDGIEGSIQAPDGTVSEV